MARCLCYAKDCQNSPVAFGILCETHQKMFANGGRVEVDIPDLKNIYNRTQDIRCEDKACL